jgi:polyferredoxin
MKKRIKIINWPRQIIQWSVLLFLVFLLVKQLFNKSFVADFEAYCPFGGIQALGSFLLNQALSCTMTTSQIVMGILLFVAVLIFSKLFCSFLCPVGTFTEWLSKLGKKLKIRITLTGWADLVLRVLKYALLFVTFYFTLQSNELFCKKYDPYYAIVTGFSTDVVVWYAVIALVLLFLGSVVIRMFWCKYICPLGALSNIFKFAGFFVIVLVAWIIALRLGAPISYVWPLAIVCLGGFIIEVVRLKSSLFPAVKITRNESSCTACNKCTKVCHQAIDVASLKVVRHVDCNLCGDCVLVCPEKNTLQVNRRNWLKWISPVAVVVLVVAGLILGSFWELPTIDLKWADEATMAKAQIYQQSGLKNVKCFGSSTAFANQMKRVNGVLGVATYVKHHRVKIYYDSEKLNAEKIQKAIFTPSKSPVTPLAKGVETVTCVTLKMENFFDALDFNYLIRLLGQKTNAVGLISEFDCPIIVKIFFPGDTLVNIEKLVEVLETRTLTFQVSETFNKVDLNYKVSGKADISKFSRGEYATMLFKPYEQKFNERETYSDEVISIYQIPLEKNAAFRARFSYLISHISNDTGIVELRTVLDSLYKEQLQVVFVDTMTNASNIFKILNSDSLQLTYTNGEKGKVENMFRFEEQGYVIEKKDSNK